MNRGALLALFAYVFWGLHPIWWKLLHHVPASQIVSHRIIWTLLFFAVINTTRHSWKRLFTKIKTHPNKWIFIAPALLLGANWGTYIWGVHANYVVEVSLGYFISPLLTVFLGIIFLHEKLHKLQWLSIIIAGCGMLYLTFIYGQIPWVSIILAGTWGLYGLLRKQSPLDSIEGLTVEMLVMFIPGLAYMIYNMSTGQSYFMTDINTTLLLIGTGLIGGIPLIAFIAGARLTSLTTIGILQYVYPTNIFLLGVFAFHEAINPDKLIGFILIWIALIIYTVESTANYKSVSAPKTR